MFLQNATKRLQCIIQQIASLFVIIPDHDDHPAMIAKDLDSFLSQHLSQPHERLATILGSRRKQCPLERDQRNNNGEHGNDSRGFTPARLLHDGRRIIRAPVIRTVATA